MTHSSQYVPIAGSIQRQIADGTLTGVKSQPSSLAACLMTTYRKSYIGSPTKATTVGFLHPNIKGMVRIRWMCDASYFLVTVDEYSTFVLATPTGKYNEEPDQVLVFGR